MAVAMTPRRGAGVLLLAALVPSLLLAACSGGDGERDDRRAGPVATTTTAAPPEPTAIAAVPSPGCGAATARPGETKVTTTSGGVERWYYLHVPPAHDGTTPVPLVLDLHGYSEGAQVHVALTGLGPYGDEHGFITVTPQGLGQVPRWDVALDSPDLDFVGHLLDEVERAACVDLARVYATGLSNGAFLASSIACRWADRVAAVAPVAGLRAVEGCDPSRPVPVIAFHGTADLYVSYDGGFGPALAGPDGSGSLAAPDLGPSIPEMAATWAIRNGCGATPTKATISEDVTLIAFDCPHDAEVQLYRITDGGHTWPGSKLSDQLAAAIGRTTMTIDANALIWSFFVQHPMPPTGG
jgi:polyhydroxybutyrate depolymerase